jgi:hypothetical protein
VKRWLPAILLLAVVPLLVLTMGHGPALPGPSSQPFVDPELGVPISDSLVAAATTSPPSVDGVMDPIWHETEPLSAGMHFGLHGSQFAGTMHLRALHDKENVYFLASWPADSPGGDPGAWRNLLTVHWRLVDSGKVTGVSTGSQGLACTVGCHTVTVDDRGQLVGIRSETIPPGLDDDLPAEGGWHDGQWLLEWSRPKVSASPYDQDLTDHSVSYRFFVKLFMGLDDRPDPTTDVHELRLRQ